MAGAGALAAFALCAAVAAVDHSADWRVTPQVKLELLTKLGVDALHIDVDSRAGRVALSGTVERRETRELATDIARAVDGVRTVGNDLRLESPPKDGDKVGAASWSEAERELKDGLLEAKLRFALVDKLGGDGFQIGTEAADGVVTLVVPKDLPSRRRAEAQKVAADVGGVTKVVVIEKS